MKVRTPPLSFESFVALFAISFDALSTFRYRSICKQNFRKIGLKQERAGEGELERKRMYRKEHREEDKKGRRGSDV